MVKRQSTTRIEKDK